MNGQELTYLNRAIELAEEALEAGDEPFGSVLVSAEGDVLAEDRNRIAGGDATQHPEKVDGPVAGLDARVHALHQRRHTGRG
ncbi:hypothetical protein [Vreelandella sulfidaeris]